MTYDCVYYIITVVMRLSIDQSSGSPIYEQIKLQIKEQIVSGEIPPQTMLPSIRVLAKELQIGIITAKRVYEDLTEEGFTTSVAGKGVFVNDIDKTEIEKKGGEDLKKRMSDCAVYAKAHGVSREEFIDIAEEVWKIR